MPPDKCSGIDNLIDDAEIARLASLSPIECDRQIKAAAERMGCKQSTLNAAVKAARGNAHNADAQGRAIELPTREPWHTAIDGADLLRDLVTAIQRHVVVGEAAASAVALWVLVSYAANAFFIFPRLLINSPEKRCGKSTLLDVIECLVQKPLQACHATAASLFRLIEIEQPTVLLDEADTYVRGNENMRNIINAGHKKNGVSMRCSGDANEPRAFHVFTPMVIATIGRLNSTIEDRGIIIAMRRKRRDETVEPFRADRPGELETLARKCVRWAQDNADRIANADPDIPEVIHNRAADNWRPLLAAADTVGGFWAEKARHVAKQMCGTSDDQSTGVMLLADIRTAYNDHHADRMSTEQIVNHLVAIEGRSWAEWKNGAPITKTWLSRQLTPFGISSGTIELPDGTSLKGFYRSSFNDAFARYLPDENVKSSDPPRSKQPCDHQNVSSAKAPTFCSAQDSLISGISDGSTLCRGGASEGHHSVAETCAQKIDHTGGSDDGA
jgi:predicted DNA-binding protein (UPF0251 family)